MKYDWRQLSPGERKALVRHVILRQESPEAVTAESICAAMQRTHFLSCTPGGKGRTVFQFFTGSSEARGGAAVAEDPVEGIYKAALRTSGVEIFDPRERIAGARARA